MKYYNLKDDVIEKYNVTFDTKEIEKIKNEIINNCSDIKHKEYKSDYSPSFSKSDIIRNYQERRTGEVKEYFEETRFIYEYSYDRYEPPYLVNLLNELLKNKNVLEDILTYKVLNRLPIDIKIEKKEKEIKGIDDKNTKVKIEKLKEYEKLLKLKKLNENQKPLSLYYDKLISLFKFELEDILSIEEVKRVQQFMGLNFLEQKGIINYHDSKIDNKKNSKNKYIFRH